MESDDARVSDVSEKPKLKFFVNAGIYLPELVARTYSRSGQRFVMTDLIEPLINKGRKLVGYPIVEYCLDSGQLVDFEEAKSDVEARRLNR